MIVFPKKTFSQFRQPFGSREPPPQRQTDRYFPQPTHLLHPEHQHPTIEESPPHLDPQQRLQKGGKPMTSMDDLKSDLEQLKLELKQLAERGKQFDGAANQQKWGRPRSNLSADRSYGRVQKQAVGVGWERGSGKEEGPKVVPIKNPNKRETELSQSLQQLREHKSGQSSSPDSLSTQETLRNLQVQVQDLTSHNSRLATELEHSRLQARTLKEDLDQQLRTASEKADTIEKLKKQRETMAKAYELKISELAKQLEKEQTQKQTMLSPQAFDSALKEQITNNQQLKTALTESHEQAAALNEQLRQRDQEILELKEEIRVREMKAAAEASNRLQRLQIQIRQGTSELSSLRKHFEVLEGRYQASTREIQQKDDFILQRLVLKGGQQPEIQAMVKQYRQLLLQEDLLYATLLRRES